MQATLLNEDISAQVREIFARLETPVELLFFGREAGCETCADTRQLVEEVAALSDLLSLSVYDLEQDAGVASQYGVDKAPGLVLAAREDGRLVDYGIRFAGIPSGNEFGTLIHDIVLVSSRDSGLGPQTRDFLKGLTRPVLLQVFVTPT
jgi:alkyl hydroperoxide reductase subunit AhpF